MYTKLAECQTVSSNFAFAHRYFLRDVTFCRIISKFTEKNWKLNSIKLLRKCVDMHDW